MMPKVHFEPTTVLYRNERGFVLALALTFLLLLTILGITAMSTSSLQEKMAQNIKDKNLSFHAAESALRHVETWLDDPNVKPDPYAVSATDGIHNAWDPPTAPFWKSINWLSDSDIVLYPLRPDGSSNGGDLFGLASQPQYILELIHIGDCPVVLMNLPGEGKKCQVFRITGRGVGGTSAATSMVQTTYKKPI